ncbi:UNVERIFIED_CONTAM: hypothetical protein K2H54_009749, partial [Gekko kuhli]
MSGVDGDETTTPPVTTATAPVTEVPVTMGPPITTPSVTALLGTQIPYYPGTFHPWFYTLTRLTQQGARALQPQILPNLFTMYSSVPLMATGQLMQWGQFHPGSTTETYLLTEGARRDSQWDPVGVPASQTLQGGATADTSSVWLEPQQGEGTRTPPEEE